VKSYIYKTEALIAEEKQLLAVRAENEALNVEEKSAVSHSLFFLVTKYDQLSNNEGCSIVHHRDQAENS
jgi:hypothetical protein